MNNDDILADRFRSLITTMVSAINRKDFDELKELKDAILSCDDQTAEFLDFCFGIFDINNAKWRKKEFIELTKEISQTLNTPIRKQALLALKFIYKNRERSK